MFWNQARRGSSLLATEGVTTAAILPPKKLVEAKDLSSYSFSDFDNIQRVKSAIASLESGILEPSATLIDAMTRDDRLSGILHTRTAALSSLPFVLESAPGGKSAAKRATDLFETLFPDATLAEFQKWAVMQGVAFGELVWETTNGEWTPRLKVWHPKFFYWRFDTRSWHVTTTEGIREIQPGNGQWVVYSPFAECHGWMHGKVRSLYVSWLLRQWAMRDAGRYSEVYGSPFRLAYTPPGVDKDDRRRFIKEVSKLSSETTINLPSQPSGEPGYDIKLVEATGAGFEGFLKLIGMANENMAIALLGQNLTTNVSGGSFAATKVHERIKGDILQGDADKLSDCLKLQCLRPWALYNYGNADLAPTPCWDTTPPEDKSEKGKAFLALGQGLASLQAIGAHPDIDSILEGEGIPVVAPAKQPSESVDSGEQMPQKKNKQLSAAIEGQGYIDALAKNATKAGASVLRKDIEKLVTALESSNSHEELKEKLVEIYGEMNADELGDVIQRALTLAAMNGIDSVLE